MSTTTARTVTTAVRRALRTADLLDAVVKVSTEQTRDGWSTYVETVTKAQAVRVADGLLSTFPAVRVQGGANFFGVRIVQPVTEKPAPATDVPPAGGRRAQLRAELARLDMTLVAGLADRLFRAWKRHGLAAECLAVRAEYGSDRALLEWVDHRLSQRIGQVAPVCLGRVPGTKNYLLDPID